MDTAEKIMIFSFLLQSVCCRDFNISLPEKIEALSGSCVIIKCRFEIKEIYDKNLTEKAAGLWHKDGHEKNNIVFTSKVSIHNSLITGNITGKLEDKDCTTVFYDVRLNHTGQYFFRIEGEDKLKWTFAKNSVLINVIDTPVKPRVQLSEEQKELQDQLEVLEGRSVSLRCSAETLCSSLPPTLTWSSTPRILLSESSKQQELIISDLNFTASRHHHNVTFTCSINYQLKDNKKTANSSITLNVQYAPQISNYSCSNSTDATECFCEVDGNPSSEVQWLLSGRPVSNSSVTLISEERLSSTGLRSFISLHQSLTNTTTLMCFSNNTHGNASLQFHLVYVPQIASWILVLIGVAAVALVIAMLCAITCTCMRKNNVKLLQTTQEGGARGSGQTADEGNQNDSVYANKDIMLSAEATTANPESIIYSSIDFTKSNPKSQEVGDISSVYTEYATVKHHSRGAMTESSRATGAHVIVSVATKPTQSMESGKVMLADTSEVYAKLQRRRP